MDLEKKNTILVTCGPGLAGFLRRELEEMGFDGLLCKPVTFEVLERAIKGAFEKINKLNPVETLSKELP